jgi:hypothetical protein
MPNTRNVLVLETDPATRSLFVEWFDEEGWQVVDPSSADAAAPLSLVVLELAFLREDGLQPLVERSLAPGCRSSSSRPRLAVSAAAALCGRSARRRLPADRACDADRNRASLARPSSR